MPYTAKHKQETRKRIIQSAAKLFSRYGFAEVSIDQIMRDAGLTHGGFYRHFKNKDELHAEAVRQFTSRVPLEKWQRKYIDPCANPLLRAQMVVDAYFSLEHLADKDGSCPLIALSSDVSRSGAGAKAAYREVIEMMVRIFEPNFKGKQKRDRALSLVAACVGGMVLARGVDDERVSSEIRAAAHRLVQQSAGWRA